MRAERDQARAEESSARNDAAKRAQIGALPKGASSAADIANQQAQQQLQGKRDELATGDPELAKSTKAAAIYLRDLYTEFGDWLLPAIIQNQKLERMKAAEKNDGRAYNMMGTFVHNIAWKDWVNQITEMEKVTKAA